MTTWTDKTWTVTYGGLGLSPGDTLKVVDKGAGKVFQVNTTGTWGQNLDLLGKTVKYGDQTCDIEHQATTPQATLKCIPKDPSHSGASWTAESGGGGETIYPPRKEEEEHSGENASHQEGY
jgi:hypothetical protein